MKLKYFLISALLCSASFAHFGLIIPNESVIEDEKDANLNLQLKFTHPFEHHIMNLVEPKEVFVDINGKRTNLIKNLKEHKQDLITWWSLDYKVTKPGIYSFVMDPKPYFEPAEDTFIRHISKTVIDAYGYGEGWDKPLDLKAEILPLTRPFGLYKGNIFTGKVLYKGKPAKNVTVEVEYKNDANLKAPSEDHITQEVKTNELGEFSFVMPLAGWWGFAALIEDDKKLSHDGKDYPVELGAVLWVETKDYIK